MSDRLKDLELELRDVIVALKDVAGTQWYDLGLQLRLSPSTLDTIAADHQTTDDCKRMMLRKWLQGDAEASWEKLAAALTLTGHKNTAAVIRRKFSLVAASSSKDEDTTEEDKIRLMLTRKNLNKIKGQFSSLLLKVQSSLKSRQITVDNVRDFLVHYFAQSDWIQNPSNVDALFTALSVTKLWNYDHYDPLEEIIKEFLPNDADMKKFVSDYKNQLTGFYTTTRIVDFIKLSDFEESEQDPQQPLPMDSFTLKDYRKLKLKLKLDRKVSAITLSYVDELWRSLAEEFDLPCLTAVIHSIIEGSLVVTWLILPNVVEKIIEIKSSIKAVKFFRNHGIVSMKIDNETIYDDKQMTKYENQLFEICGGRSGNVSCSIFSELKDYGIDFNMFNGEGYTPLYLASYSGNSSMVRILLEYGAQVNKQNNDKWGVTPLMAACWNSHIKTARILVKNGAAVNNLNKVGQSPLYVASGYGQIAAVKFLLEHGANVNLPNKDARGHSALIVACLDGFVDIVRILLEHGAVVDYQDKKGDSALLAACRKGYDEIVKELLNFGAQVNLQTSDTGITPLTFACIKERTAIAKVLIEHGAIIDFIDKKGHTTLYDASSHGSTEAVKLLVQNGADVNLTTEDGLSNSALISACSFGYSETARVLLDHGAKVNYQNVSSVSALCYASYFGHANAVSVLLEYEAEVNLPNNEGRTAIFYAAEKDYVDIVQLLMHHGVDLELKDKNGLTAYDVVNINSHPDVCHLMKAYKYQAHHSGSSDTKNDTPTGVQTRYQHDEIISLDTFRAVLEHGASQSQDDAALKHQTSQMSEESEEKDL